ncbi:MAG: TIM barrel protein, partial [Rhodobacteraceae bacterium]|nr:TIM barrel protein [Paracoccaceae bacterium]
LDHSSSSTPDEFAKMAEFAENLELIMAGDGPRVPNQGELLNLQNLGRSYYAKVAIAEGESVTRDKIVLHSPRTGLGQEDIGPLLGKAAVRQVGKDKVIDRSVFERPQPVDEATLAWARTAKLSLPVRFHDMDDLARRLPTGHFEFHLTFGDVAGDIDAAKFDRTNHYSVHLPDYVSSTLLMDPFSPRADQREASDFVLNRTVEFAKALQDRTGRDCLIVGSFSNVHGSLEMFFNQHAELLSTHAKSGVTILPQWLPPIAWYFGGAARLKAMNNLADIDLIKRHQMPICMDVCHLCMGDKVFDFVAADVVKDLAPLIRHVHIADALGHDGEGLPFGEGDPGNMDAIAAAMTLDGIKVIEVWQGHLNGGDGFARALIDLKERFDGRQ